MTTTTAEIDPGTSETSRVAPTLVEDAAATAPTLVPPHTAGSTYTCPACRQAEREALTSST